MKSMKLIALFSMMSVLFVLTSFVANAKSYAGWKGDLYGAAAVWNWYYSDPYIFSSHAAWLENHGPRSVAYSWEFKTGLPEVDVSVEQPGSGSLKPNKAIFPQGNPISIHLDSEGVTRRDDPYEWKLYTRMDVGAKSWRVDVKTTVSHLP